MVKNGRWDDEERNKKKGDAAAKCFLKGFSKKD